LGGSIPFPNQQKQLDNSLMMKTFIRNTIVLGAVLGLTSGLWAQAPDPFKEEYVYYNNRNLGERLVVKFPQAETELSKSVEMIIFDESYYNSSASRYDKRQVAIFTGMGMGSSGLKVVLNDHTQRSMLVTVLERFIKTKDTFLEIEEDVIEKRQDWMGDGWNAIAGPRILGNVYFYPTKTIMESTFNFDPEMGRIWLNMGSRVFMDHEVIPYISKMVSQIPAYQDKLVSLRNDLGRANDEIDRSIGADRVRAKL